MAFTRFSYICVGKSNSSYYSKNDKFLPIHKATVFYSTFYCNNAPLNLLVQTIIFRVGVNVGKSITPTFQNQNDYSLDSI